MTVDLSAYTNVYTETFDEGLSTYDGETGVWTTDTRRDSLQTNSNMSVFLDGEEVTSDGEQIGINPFSVDDGVLHIGSGQLTGDDLTAVQDVLEQTGETDAIETTKYYTGGISTDATWGQTYGYFEAVMKVPEGEGHWSAFWLKHAGEGWPPETTFEFYGRGLEGDTTKKDNTFTTMVLFDAENQEGTDKVNDVDISNDYVHVDADGNVLYNEDGSFDTTSGTGHDTYERWDDTYRFTSINSTTDGSGRALDNDKIKQSLDMTGHTEGDSIYDQFWTYGIEWTEETIIFWMGKDRDSMEIVYQTPTSDDHHVPMSLMINDQIGTHNGWWDPVLDEDGNPQEGMFGGDNDVEVQSVSIFMIDPDKILQGSGNGAVLIGTDEKEQIIGTDGDDRIVTGHGEDVITLGGGADIVWADRGIHNKIIEDFGADDVLVLEGYNIANAEDALNRLTQVGDDVWLSNGSYPASPQTILFRDVQVSDFSADNFVVRWSETPDIWASLLRDSVLKGDIAEDGYIYANQGWVDVNKDGEIQNDPNAEGYEKVGVGSRFYDTVGSKGMVGSMEGDQYFGVRGDSVIIEAENGGIDTVFTTVDYVMAENVENLTSRYGDAKDTGKMRTFTGNDMDNWMIGSTGNEAFQGAAGDDLIDLREGGSDQVLYSKGDGHDKILSFGADDKIVLQDIGFDSWAALQDRMSSSGGDTIIDLGTGQSIRLEGIDKSELQQDQFEFSNGGGAVDGHGSDVWQAPVQPSETSKEMDAKTWMTLSEDELTQEDLNPYFDQFVDGSLTRRTEPNARSDESVLILGNDEDNKMIGSVDADAFLLMGGSDIIRSGAEDNFIFGGDGNDAIKGNKGADVLRGGEGNDRLLGQIGDDTLWGGDGRDKIVGGSGADLILLSIDDSKRDIIFQFDGTEGDRIAIDLGAEADALTLNLIQHGKGVRIVAEGESGNTILARVNGAQIEDVQDYIDLGWDFG